MTTSRKQPTFAQRIHDTVKTRTPVKAQLKTSESILARITDGIYRQPASALRELISNAYDADATDVTILTDAPRFKQISIIDNGFGLSEESLRHLIEHIGGSAKRTPEGAALHLASEENVNFSPGGRKLIGKMGIGLFSVAQFTRHFLIITKCRGSSFRIVADITLGQLPSPGDPSASGEITTGEASIWAERTKDVESHGTEIKLLNLLPRTKAELCSVDRWTKIDYEIEEDGKASTSPPVFHIGRSDPANVDDIAVDPNLPWKPSDKPRRKFEKFVERVRSLADTDNGLVDLDAVCDNYLLTLWTLALSAPLGYVDRHPFDLRSDADVSYFELENRTRGQAKALVLPDNESPRKLLGLEAPFRPKGDRFDITVDGVQLSRPIVFTNQPKTQNAVKTPLMFIGRCREEFGGKHITLSGGPLAFEAYLFWTPKVLPTQHQGVMLRIGDAAGTPFDRTFMGYQVSEQTRLRQITAEIFIREGLDAAINLDRESFNFAHPHYQFLVKWMHSALRQLTNKHKEVGATLRQQRLARAGSQAQRALEKTVVRVLKERGIDDLPEVRLLEAGEKGLATSLRKEGVVALSKTVVPQSAGQRRTKAQSQRASFNEQKVIAITQILASWGLLERLSFAEQEQLVREILEVALSEVDQ